MQAPRRPRTVALALAAVITGSVLLGLDLLASRHHAEAAMAATITAPVAAHATAGTRL